MSHSRIDIIGQNGNDGLHYLDVKRRMVEDKLANDLKDFSDRDLLIELIHRNGIQETVNSYKECVIEVAHDNVAFITMTSKSMEKLYE